jgi:hypothetical protein
LVDLTKAQLPYQIKLLRNKTRPRPFEFGEWKVSIFSTVVVKLWTSLFLLPSVKIIELSVSLSVGV